MAYDSNNLSALAYANGFTHWHYKSTADTLATIMAAGYFSGAAPDMLRVGDTIRIQASDGFWKDVIFANDGTTVQVGVDAGLVQDSLVGAIHRLGYKRKRWDESEWTYLEAGGTIAACDVVEIAAANVTASITATTQADSTGMGMDLAVAAETLSQAIAIGDFHWGCIKAPIEAGVKFNAVASVEKFSQLYASATPGSLTDVAAAGVKVDGIISTEEDDTQPVGVISYPRVSLDLII